MSLYRNILVLIALIAISCGDSSSSQTTPTTGDPSSTGVQPAPPAFQPPTAPPPTAEPAQNAEGVWHYTCPKGCAGGGGSAVPCGNCGTTLVHNTGYHSGGNTQTQPPIELNQTTPPPPPTAEPAQNAQGVWHFICPNGHEGGGSKIGPCGVCGTDLVHNSGYHQ
jgi:hypothetical protein